MNVPLPIELRRALEAYESEELSKIIRAHRREHFESLRRLVSTDPAVKKEYRQKAIYALGQWGDTNAVPDIERILPELDEPGRIAAIDALGRLGTKQALKAVNGYASDPSPQVRKVVVQALSRIDDTEAKTRLRTIANEDREGWIREMAAKQIKKR